MVSELKLNNNSPTVDTKKIRKLYENDINYKGKRGLKNKFRIDNVHIQYH